MCMCVYGVTAKNGIFITAVNALYRVCLIGMCRVMVYVDGDRQPVNNSRCIDLDL
jgi:hypothetical protein